MLMPAELQNLAVKTRRLTPDLAMGWKIGAFIRDFYGDLSDIRLAARESGDAVIALASMLEDRLFGGKITTINKDRPWDFLSYQHSTGVTISFHLLPELSRLPRQMRDIESDLVGMDPFTRVAYNRSVQMLTKEVAANPLESFCRIVQSCYHPLDQAEGDSLILCQCCNRPAKKGDLWFDGEIICCTACSGLEPSWFEWQ